MDLKTVTGLLQKNEPVLKDPEGLTADVMTAIQTTRVIRPFPWLVPLERMLVAASVSLLLVFGYEQYGIIIQVGNLEQQLSDAGKESRFTDLQNREDLINQLSTVVPFHEAQRILSGLKPRSPFSAIDLTNVKVLPK